MQIIAKSPYMAELVRGTLSREDLKEMIKFARRDPRAKLAKKLLQLDQEAIKEHAKTQVL